MSISLDFSFKLMCVTVGLKHNSQGPSSPGLPGFFRVLVQGGSGSLKLMESDHDFASLGLDLDALGNRTLDGVTT